MGTTVYLIYTGIVKILYLKVSTNQVAVASRRSSAEERYLEDKAYIHVPVWRLD